MADENGQRGRKSENKEQQMAMENEGGNGKERET